MSRRSSRRKHALDPLDQGNQFDLDQELRLKRALEEERLKWQKVGMKSRGYRLDRGDVRGVGARAN